MFPYPVCFQLLSGSLPLDVGIMALKGTFVLTSSVGSKKNCKYESVYNEMKGDLTGYRGEA